MPLSTSPKAKSRSEEFTGFYTAHFGRIAAQLHAYLGDRWEAQDLTQEAFCRAYDRWGTISTYERPDFWVRQVAWNLATNRLRHLRVAMRHLSRQREEHVDGPNPDRVALVGALAKLPPKQRLAIVLHHIGGLSTPEIAAQQDVAEGTVRSWLTRGRAALAEHLIEAHPEWDKVPEIAETFSRVRRKRAIRRATLAAVLAVLVALPLAILLRGEGSEPPFIGPTGPVTMLSPTPPAKAVSACTAKTLPGLPNEPGVALLGGEPTGRHLVGVNERDSGQPRPVLWTDGVPSTFAIPGGFLTGIAVNSVGVVAGSTYDEAGTSFKVWTYYHGQVSIVMDSRKVSDARPVVAINTRGDILLGNGPAGQPLLRLAGRRPVLRELPAPDGATEVFPMDLSEDGTVVGYTDDSDSAVVWRPGQAVRRLPAPGEGWSTMAWRVRGEWVVGAGQKTASYDPATGTYANRALLRWNLGTDELTQVTGTDSAKGVTSQGWMLRETEESKGSIDINGTLVALPTVTDGPPINDPTVSFISDDGRVVGGGSRYVSNGRELAIAWSCS